MKLALSTRASGDLNLSPVLLFALLLFFLFPLCFAQIDSQEREKLPLRQRARPAVAAAEGVLLIQVSQSGSIQIGGEDVPADALPAVLKRERDILQLSRGRHAGQASAVIRADRKTPGGKIQEVVKAAQEAHFEEFLLQVRPEASASAGKEPVR
jgi:biopolymer transport protein ExbD